MKLPSLALLGSVALIWGAGCSSEQDPVEPAAALHEQQSAPVSADPEIPSAEAPADAPVADPVQQPSAPKAPPLVMKLRTLLDKGMRNMESHTVLAPEDWTVEGGAWWAPQPYFNILPSREIVARAPDGVFVRVSPGATANDYEPSMAAQQMGIQRAQEGAADNGYPVVYFPGNKSAWKRWIQSKVLPVDLPDAKKIRVKKVEDLAEMREGLERMVAPMFQQMEQSNQQNAALGMGMLQFGEVLSYSFEGTYEQEGQDFEFVMVLGCIIYGFETEMGRQTSWSIEPCMTFAAPKGELEEKMPLLMTIAGSVRETPGWAKMKADHIRQMNRIAAKGAADRARVNSDAAAARADSGPSVGDILFEGWKKNSAISDRSNSRFNDSIREVDHYTVAGSSESVTLPSGYGHIYSNGNGEYLLTNDALYNPNTDSAVNTLNWDVMTPVE